MNESDSARKDLAGEFERIRTRSADPASQEGRSPADTRALEAGGLAVRIAETSPVGVVLVDAEGELIYANRRAEEIFGLPRDRILQRSYNSSEWRITDRHGAPLPEPQLPFSLVRQNIEPLYDYPMAVERSEGRRILLAVNAAPLLDAAGRFEGMVATLEDVTEGEAAREALRRSEERYQRLLAALTTYTYTVFLHKGEVFSTEHCIGCVSATGYTPDDFSRNPYLWLDMIHPADRQAVLDRIARVFGGEEAVSFEHRIIHRNGSVRWLRDTIVAHRDPAGVLVQYDGVVEDITERKRAEERFRSLVEMAPDGMVIVDAQGDILLVNAQVERLFGYGREELIGQEVEILVPEGYRGSHRAERGGYAVHPAPRPMGSRPELSARRKDGSEFPVEISLSPLETDEGIVISAAIRDISARKRAEQTLRENEAQFLAARRIQEYLLPGSPPPLPGYDLAGASFPADTNAGDYFDFLALPGGRLGLVVGDVSGHGVGPAVLMALTHMLVRSLSGHHGDPAELLAAANAILIEETDADHFVTLILAALDPAARTVTWVSAGHPSGFVLGSHGDSKATLESTGLPLGVLAGAQYHLGPTVRLAAGDLLLLVSDGTYESRAPGGEILGISRMLDVVRRHRTGSARDVIEALYDATRRHAGNRNPPDDVTAVAVKVR